MSESLVLVVAGLAAAALVLAAALAARRREPADPGLAAMQQQLDALRVQVGQSLDGAARALAERSEALQSQVTARLEEATRTMNTRLAENAQTLQRVNESLAQRLDANLQIVGQRFTETTGMVTTVHEKLRGLEEAATRIFEVGKDLTSLQEILQPPKLRGGVGEVLLENLLRDRLPQARYAMQHRFSNGRLVDAVIRLEDRLVPVDSKFPVEGFRTILKASTDDERTRARREFVRAVQGHIKDIAEKYIQPGEGTFDFALMYVPAENVYYEAIVQGDEPDGLYAYAMERRVIPVSPTTFYAYLVAMVYGLKGLQVEQQAAKIREGLAHLHIDFERVRRAMDTLGQQLRHAQVNYSRASEALDRFSLRLQATSGVSLPEPEPQVLPLGDGGEARS
jgi:DNA recombination protein RmuC